MAKPTVWKREKLPDQIKEYARQMRKKPTQAERKLWEQLKNKKLVGAKFRRQQPLAGFILDFYCDKFKLCVEVDGGIHQQFEQAEYDKSRDKYLNELGIRTIRFKNDEIETDLSSVLKKLQEFLK
jgi:very-short-patch-repair endonuclease